MRKRAKRKIEASLLVNNLTIRTKEKQGKSNYGKTIWIFFVVVGKLNLDRFWNRYKTENDFILFHFNNLIKFAKGKKIRVGCNVLT